MHRPAFRRKVATCQYDSNSQMSCILQQISWQCCPGQHTCTLRLTDSISAVQAASTAVRRPEAQPERTAGAAASGPSFRGYWGSTTGEQSPHKLSHHIAPSSSLAARSESADRDSVAGAIAVASGGQLAAAGFGGRDGDGVPMRHNELFEWAPAAAASPAALAPLPPPLLRQVPLQAGLAPSQAVQQPADGGSGITQPRSFAPSAWHAAKPPPPAEDNAIMVPLPDAAPDATQAAATRQHRQWQQEAAAVPLPAELPQLNIEGVVASPESFNSEQGFGSPVRRHNGACDFMSCSR